MRLQEAREQIVEYGKELSRAGLCTGTSGNLSIYDAQQGLVAISPSGIGYFETTPEDVVLMDLEGHVVEGKRKPSSEWALHTLFYKNKPQARGVVHTHSMYCTTLSVLQQPIQAVHYVIGGAGAARVPCTPYVLFGTKELAELAIKTAGSSNAVLLGNHGLVACGKSLDAAFSLARNLEYVAELQIRAMSVGVPHVLSEEEMQQVMERFKTYGQGTDEKTGY